jgi:hypothetical protein
LIILAHVIEHIYSPLDFLSKVQSYLKPGGLMAVATPNKGSLWFPVMRERWPSFKVPEHITFYEKKTLSLLLEKTGLTDIEKVAYLHAFPLALTADKLKMKVPRFMEGISMWIPGTTIALVGEKTFRGKTMRDFLVSIVIPVYCEEKQIKKSVVKIHNILSDKKIGHEFILIDDGSKDDSWKAIVEMLPEIPGIRAIRLSRNFGKESALCAGLEAVEGDACVILDADLQHPPEIIPEMVRLWREEGYDVVEVSKHQGEKRA